MVGQAQQLAAVDAAEQGIIEAKAARDAAELAFGQGTGDWKTVEAAELAHKQAAARLRGVTSALSGVGEAVAIAERELLEVEAAICSELSSAGRLKAELDEALVPLAEAWPKVAAALEEVARIRRRFIADTYEAHALASQLEGAGMPPLTCNVEPWVVSDRFEKLVDTGGLQLPAVLVEAAFEAEAKR